MSGIILLVSDRTAIQAKTNSVIVTNIIAGIFFTVLSAVLLSIALKKIIFNPLESLTSYSREISNSNFNAVIDNRLLERKDEMGTLASSFSTAKEETLMLISKIGEIASNLGEATNILDDNIIDILDSSNNISSTMEHLSDGAESQALDTQGGTENLVRLSELLSDNNKLVDMTSNTVDNVISATTEGKELIESLQKISKENFSITEGIADIVKKTQTSSEQIMAASDLIRNISDQTQLLSLNASIEAARAGDAGRGFGVVAGEMAKLAEQSGSGAGSINQDVEILLANANSAVKATEEMVELVENQEKIVLNAGEQYEGIDKNIKDIGEMAYRIKESVANIEGQKNMLLDMMESLSAVSEENAAAANEVEESSEQQTNNISKLQEESELLKAKAYELRNEVSKYSWK